MNTGQRVASCFPGARRLPTLAAHAWPIWLSGWALLLSSSSAPAQAPASSPGLEVTFTPLEGAKTAGKDVVVLPNVWLYVPASQPPSPFLPAARFSAVWNGFVSVDLRSDGTFQAELNGGLRVEINGQVVWDTAGTGEKSAPSKTTSLNKGTNAFKVSFSSPSRGDAFIRLSWQTDKGPFEPIPLTALSHVDSPGLQQGAQLRLGRELFLEHRCVKCHAAGLAAAEVPELAMDAPTLEGIGARRNRDWMARWILDPKSLRPQAQMAALLGGPKAGEDAQSVAAFLASLKTEPEMASADLKPEERAPSALKTAESPDAQPQENKTLFDKLRCTACHTTPNAAEKDATKITLKHVAEKFPPGSLAGFLKRPEAHYAWIRMPNFRLSAAEVKELTDFLLAAADRPGEAKASIDKTQVERGRTLVQTSGCLNCHGLKLDNRFATKDLSALSAGHSPSGCLAASPGSDSKAPRFGFTPEERAGLLAFLATDRASLARHVPAEFAERQTRSLQCSGCHGQGEGFPPLELIGGKLKPEWTAAFIGGRIPYKPRPWLDARMPAFPARAERLAAGLAMAHGFAPQTPAEPNMSPAAAAIGQKLVGTDGGFSCVACHAVGSQAATQVFESEGINLSYSAERLLRPYFERWLMNPQKIDPQTKMPVYFDEEGKSQLNDVLDGNAAKQLDALWQYLRLGRKMQPPGTGQ